MKEEESFLFNAGRITDGLFDFAVEVEIYDQYEGKQSSLSLLTQQFLL